MLSDIENEISDIEKVSTIIPFGILCWYTAAEYHDLTTVNPSAIYIAVPSIRTRVSIPESPPVVLIASSQKTFELGLQTIGNENMSIRIYDRERTVCDFFRKRNLLGIDLAIEVLRNYMSGKRDLQRLFKYAEKLRIKNVIRPYVEALL